MRSSHSLDRLDTAFDDDRLVADAGLLLPATLAAHLGLKDLVDEHLDLGDRPGRGNAGDKLLTLVMSALAGGDCIDDANALRAGVTEAVLWFRAKAASTSCCSLVRPPPTGLEPPIPTPRIVSPPAFVVTPRRGTQNLLAMDPGVLQRVEPGNRRGPQLGRRPGAVRRPW